jgi:hypothetical protein
VSNSQEEQESAPGSRHVSAIKIEAVADELIALLEEFERTLSEGHVPPEFAERLAELRQTAERLINP